MKKRYVSAVVVRYQELLAMTEAELLVLLEDGRTASVTKNSIGSILVSRQGTSAVALRSVEEYCPSEKLETLAAERLQNLSPA